MTGTSFDLRPARPSDLPALNHMLRMIYDRDIAAVNTAKGRQSFFSFIRPPDFLSRLENGSRLYLLWQDSWLAGCLERKDGHILLLFIHPQYRRQGLARRLIQAALADLRSAGLPATLTLNASPNAYAAYARLGFRPIGTEFERAGIRARPLRLDARLGWS
ncbi:MAG: GNAT family N-acetyltransferase [Bacteroidetes bacterium]|nr:MAG: GNAT family N-acetyltransferase [Bacteroidota bacterium]